MQAIRELFASIALLCGPPPGKHTTRWKVDLHRAKEAKKVLRQAVSPALHDDDTYGITRF